MNFKYENWYITKIEYVINEMFINYCDCSHALEDRTETLALYILLQSYSLIISMHLTRTLSKIDAALLLPNTLTKVDRFC